MEEAVRGGVGTTVRVEGRISDFVLVLVEVEVVVLM